MNGSPKEQFEKIRARYDGIYDQFVEFHHSPIGAKYSGPLGSFIHEANRLARKVGGGLLKGELPERGKTSKLWGHYHNLRDNMRIMELILELSKEK